MKIPNIFTLNDISIKKFFIIIFVFQTIILGLYALENLGIKIPLVREVIGIISLFFFPGLMVLRALKLHQLGTIETILYSLGISLSVIMLTGFAINIILPILGNKKPISSLPVLITFLIITCLLCIVCYIRDRTYEGHEVLDIPFNQTQMVALLLLLPFFSFFSILIFDSYNNGFLIVCLYLAIAGIFFILVVKPSFGAIYPFAIFCFSLSLLYSTGLQSTYIIGADIHHELIVSNIILDIGYWDSSLVISNIYLMLSIIFLAPIYSLTTGLNLIVLFKVVFPFLYSFMAVCMYRVIEKQSESRIALLAVFAFMIIAQYYGEMISLVRQQVAEIFVALLLLIILDKKLEYWQKTLFCILFIYCIIVSHYGIATIFLGVLCLAFIIMIFLYDEKVSEMLDKLSSARTKISISFQRFNYSDREILNIKFLILFLILFYAWYVFLSKSSYFEQFINIIEFSKDAVLSSDPAVISRPGESNLIQPLASYSMRRGFNFIFGWCILGYNVFIIIGILSAIIYYRKTLFNPQYLAIIISFGIISALSVVFPIVARPFNFSRLYLICNIFISVFFVIGGITIARIIAFQAKTQWSERYYKMTLMVLSVVLIFLLMKHTQTAFYLIGQSDSPFLSREIDGRITSESELKGTGWLDDYREKFVIFTDPFRVDLIKGRIYPPPDIGDIGLFDRTKSEGYIFLGGFSTRFELILTFGRDYIHTETLIKDENKIYSTGGSTVYYAA